MHRMLVLCPSSKPPITNEKASQPQMCSTNECQEAKSKQDEMGLDMARSLWGPARTVVS